MRQFEDVDGSLVELSGLRLASPNAGAIYHAVWLCGVLGGTGAIMVLCVTGLVQTLTRKRRPGRPKLLPVDKAEQVQ
jgi:hypothetical protein